VVVLYSLPNVGYNQYEYQSPLEERLDMPSVLYQCPVTMQKGCYQLEDAWEDFYEWAEAYFGPFHLFEDQDLLPLPCYGTWKKAGEPHSHEDFMKWLKGHKPKIAARVAKMPKVPKAASVSTATEEEVAIEFQTSAGYPRKKKPETQRQKMKKVDATKEKRSAAGKKAWETRKKQEEKAGRKGKAKCRCEEGLGNSQKKG
jgi:hypothetical protein